MNLHPRVDLSPAEPPGGDHRVADSLQPLRRELRRWVAAVNREQRIERQAQPQVALGPVVLLLEVAAVAGDHRPHGQARDVFGDLFRFASIRQPLRQVRVETRLGLCVAGLPEPHLAAVERAVALLAALVDTQLRHLCPCAFLRRLAHRDHLVGCKKPGRSGILSEGVALLA